MDRDLDKDEHAVPGGNLGTEALVAAAVSTRVRLLAADPGIRFEGRGIAEAVVEAP